MNIAAASIGLQPGDEVLLTDHEYGAVRNIWQDKCKKTGARITTASLPIPLNDDATVSAIEEAVTSKTKVIVVSHVTSPTAAILPVNQVCRMAKQHGILTVVDGPHAIAMLDVALGSIGCDFYCTSCHKWLCAPFGSGFLWVHPKHHATIHCPIVSWGGSIAGRQASWQDRTNWLGTYDPASVLSIPSAISFLRRHRLRTFRNHARSLACYARQQLLNINGVGPFCTKDETDFVSMCAVELPQPENWKPGYHGHPDPLQVELRNNYGIEVPVGSWNGHRFLRVSAHLYNSTNHVDRLIEALNRSENLR